MIQLRDTADLTWLVEEIVALSGTADRSLLITYHCGGANISSNARNG